MVVVTGIDCPTGFVPDHTGTVHNPSLSNDLARIMIEAVLPDNFDEVLPLIREYQAFYQVSDISDERNRLFFARFGPDSADGCLFAYRQDGKVVGFATVYFSFSSTLTAKVGVMNDLYTLAECRGKGIGRALINHCRDYAVLHGAARLQWVTAMDNQRAQQLYDSLKTAKKPWLFYTYMPEPSAL